MNSTEELVEDCDSSDDDYVPDKKTEVLSEVESDGDPEDSLSEIEDDEGSVKRRKNSRKPKKKQKTTENEYNNSTSKSTIVSDEDKKKKDEDIWADFMKDTGFQSRKSVNMNIPTNRNTTLPTEINNKKPNLVNKPQEKVKITKVFEFAGEEIAIEKEVPVNSAEARLLNKSTQNIQSKNTSKGGLSGIGGILNQLGKKPKISTLEKSKLDWDKFKKEENLEEELQSHNKGKDGYLERQDFLQRADLRRFEIEKEIRTVERNRRMNNSL